jgi:hypothetical protein
MQRKVDLSDQLSDLHGSAALCKDKDYGFAGSGTTTGSTALSQRQEKTYFAIDFCSKQPEEIRCESPPVFHSSCALFEFAQNQF